MPIEEKLDELTTLIKSISNNASSEATAQVEIIKSIGEQVQNDILNSLPKDTFTKSYRLLKNIHTYASLMIQEVYVDNSGEIKKYGRVLHRGHSLSNLTSGAARSHSSIFSEVALPNDIEFCEVFGGHNVFYALPKDGNFLYVWGVNASGCAGTGNTNNIPLPMKIDLGFRPKKILSGNSLSTGKQTTLILGEDGKVYGAGSNACGELGIGNTLNSSTFIQSPYLKDIVDLSFASNGTNGYALAVDIDGNLWSFGFNGTGNLGVNSTTNVSIPIKTTFNSKIVGISTAINNASATSLVIFEDGTLRGAGYNAQYQLSSGNNTNSSVFVRALKANGDDLINIKKAYASSINGTCFAIDDENNLWSFGYGGFGFGDTRTGNSLGASIALEGVESIEMESNTNTRAYAKLKDAKQILAFGFNTDGSLGNGTLANTREFTSIYLPANLKDFKLYSFHPDAHFVALCDDGIYSCGTPKDGSINIAVQTLQNQL